MSNVINNSTHPVEIKKISISLWTLRDEIEKAIGQRLQEDPENQDIEDIKKFYIDMLNRDVSAEADEDDDEDERQDDNLDSSGNPMDDDAAAMMAALAGGDEESEEGESEDDSPEEAEAAESEEDAEEAGKEDDEAARLAAEMLAGQGGDSEASESEEGESDELAEGESDSIQNKEFERPLPSKKTEAFLMLSDINMDEIMLFSKGPFVHGQNVVIRFNIPNSFTMLATVLRSVDISRNSKIISVAKPSHRLHAKFEFKFPGERDTLRQFLKSIEPTIPAPPKKMKRPESDDDDDDFDDLGF